MHACPCCGFRTLPSRGDYELCPVCWWEDDGGVPWEHSGPNGETLVEAQQTFLAETRPFRRRTGKVRRPKRHEARDPHWRPIELTPQLWARVQQSRDAEQRYWAEQERQVAREVAADPEGPFKEFNTGIVALGAEVSTLSADECVERVRALGAQHGVGLPDAYLELLGRTMKDPDYYLHHPLHAARWMLRTARPGTVRLRWQELRTGSFHLAG